MSQFVRYPHAPLRILLRVISRGRDRLLEIGSNELLSHFA